MSSRRRINKRQMEVMLEKLHANLVVVRGNSACPRAVEMWKDLSLQLNTLGCCRDVTEWQQVWTTWVTKVRAKARKVRNSILGTGGGPAVPPLTDQDERVLEISGRAAVDGFTSQETRVGSRDVGLHRHPARGDSLSPPSVSGDGPSLLVPATSPENAAYPALEIELAAAPSNPDPVGRRMPFMRRPARPSRAQRMDPAPLLQAMVDNGRALREAVQGLSNAVTGLGESISAGLLGAAHIIRNDNT